jgi:hypothetical protein
MSARLKDPLRKLPQIMIVLMVISVSLNRRMSVGSAFSIAELDRGGKYDAATYAACTGRTGKVPPGARASRPHLYKSGGTPAVQE